MISILKTVDTFVINVWNATSVKLVVTGFGLVSIFFTAGVASELIIGKTVLREIISSM